MATKSGTCHIIYDFDRSIYISIERQNIVPGGAVLGAPKSPWAIPWNYNFSGTMGTLSMRGDQDMFMRPASLSSGSPVILYRALQQYEAVPVDSSQTRIRLKVAGTNPGLFLVYRKSGPGMIAPIEIRESDDSVHNIWYLLRLAPMRSDVRALFINADELISKSPTGSYPEVIEDAQLEAKMREIAGAIFREEFGFDYDGQKTTAPGRSLGKRLTSIEGLVTVPHGGIDQAKECFSNLFSDQKNPQWLIDRGTADVCSMAEKVFKDCVLRKWKRSVLSKTFVQGDIQVDARVVYLYADANLGENENDNETEPDVGNETETLLETVVYYLGVYYGMEE